MAAVQPLPSQEPSAIAHALKVHPAIGGQREQPASAALTMVPEPMETDPSLTVDVRSQDERDRDAVSGWMRWQGFLGHLPAQHRTVLHNARRQDGPVLWSGAATEAGLLALEALRGLAEAEGRRGVS